MVFEADKLGIYIANREVLHEMRGNVGNVPDIDLVQNGEQKTVSIFYIIELFLVHLEPEKPQTRGR